MSKNVKAVLQPVVSALANKCSKLDNIEALESYEVYISEDDYNLIENNKIQQIGLFQPSFTVKFGLYEWNASYYLVESGMPELSSMRESEVGFMGMDNDDYEALYFVFLNQAGVQIKASATADEIYNAVFTEEYKTDRIPRESIERFFQEVNIYKIDEGKIGLPTPVDEYLLKQLSLKYICSIFQENTITTINLSTEAINRFDKLSENTDHLIPIDNLVQSIMAYRWNFVFLDLYRCIERLYVIGWVLDYSETFNSPLGKEDVHAKLIERFIAHHEDEIINYLFTKLDSNLLSELDAVRCDKKQADYIYDLRNSIVHYQTSDVILSDDEWNNITIFLLKAIDALYTFLKDDIITLGNKEFKKDKSNVVT